jgi:hypothetical protein
MVQNPPQQVKVSMLTVKLGGEGESPKHFSSLAEDYKIVRNKAKKSKCIISLVNI